MTPPSPSPSSSSTRCLLVAMVTSPSVPPYGEAGRLEDILEERWWVGGWVVGLGGGKKRKKTDREGEKKRGENSEQYSKGSKVPHPPPGCGTCCRQLLIGSAETPRPTPPHSPPPLSFSQHVPNTLHESHLPVIRPNPFRPFSLSFAFGCSFSRTLPLFPPQNNKKHTHTPKPSLAPLSAPVCLADLETHFPGLPACLLSTFNLLGIKRPPRPLTANGAPACRRALWGIGVG